MHASDAPARPDRIELILHKLETIPTPSPIAVRLLSLASDEDATAGEVARLIEADPGLTARLLAMCQGASAGVRQPVTTVERAVVLLGFEAVRSAALSLELYDFVVGSDEDASADDQEGRIDRVALWRHSLAVACAAELIASEHPRQGVKPDEAFVCGLLHDLGKVALDIVLPKASARAWRLAEHRRSSVVDAERDVIGLDHHAAGRRLAERWGLPDPVRDAIWLHGAPLPAGMNLVNSALVGMITAADALARRLYLGASGNAATPASDEELTEWTRLDPDALRRVEGALPERLSERAADLGFEDSPGSKLLMESVAQANRRLSRLNATLAERSRQAGTMRRALRAIESFREALPAGASLMGVIETVGRAAMEQFESRQAAVVHQHPGQEAWEIVVLSAAAGETQVETMTAAPPPGVERVIDVAASMDAAFAPPGLLEGWIRQAAPGLELTEGVLVAPLCASKGEAALVVCPAPPAADGRSEGARAVLGVWASALEAAASGDRARRLTDQLSEAMRAQADMRRDLAEREAMARLGELAGGAAHEMNNPLAVISGRAQMLLDRLSDGHGRTDAAAIVRATRQLSDLISALHEFASPPPLERRATDLTDLLGEVAQQVRQERELAGLPAVQVHYRVQGPIPPAWVDARRFADAVAELIRNAQEANPATFIELRIQTDPLDDRLMVTVSDDGAGMSPRALRHAFDPFFSEKPAGRQAGLGLARVRRLIERHGGRVELESEPGRGATARIVLEQWRRAEGVDEPAPAEQAA